MSDRSSTLTHVYGLAGLIPGVVSIFYLVNTNASWREYVLVGSGWTAALIYALLLLRAFSVARSDGEAVGKLSEQVSILKGQVEQRGTTADYLASLLLGRVATPRIAVANERREEDET